MVKRTWETVWERFRAGKHVSVTGSKALPSAPSNFQVLYVYGGLTQAESVLGRLALPGDAVTGAARHQGVSTGTPTTEWQARPQHVDRVV
jgi:hypothetical protein